MMDGYLGLTLDAKIEAHGLLLGRQILLHGG